MTKYDRYRGDKRWKVEHPEHGSVIVAAPNKDAAIFAAAQAWKCKWTDCSFHQKAEASLM